MLREAWGRSSRVAIFKYAWSGRERLGPLRLRGDVIVLQAMRWPDEVRDPAAVDPPHEAVGEQEIEGALALIDRMTREGLEGPEFTDAYTDALAKIIEAKREEKPLPDVLEPEQPGKVLDLMAALTESVQQARALRGEDADVHEMPARKSAKKQPAKKTTAKKATKKTAARRSGSA
ncbi:Ku protein [Streptomyces sp. NPDC001652]|uniref:Ku protein n=1 Tax=Streptomyces sp. NPDC001652 TaxID=3154393 RepID=UPI00333186F7